jgi:hypothetical protein
MEEGMKTGLFSSQVISRKYSPLIPLICVHPVYLRLKILNPRGFEGKTRLCGGETRCGGQGTD